MNRAPYYNKKLLSVLADFFSSSQSKMYYGGLLAISLVIAQAFFPLQHLDDLPSLISMVAFTIAIPLLTGAFYTVSNMRQHGVIDPLIPFLIVQQLGTTAAVVGVTAAFWHLSWILGVLFLISTLIAAFIYSYIVTKTNGMLQKVVQGIEEM